MTDMAHFRPHQMRVTPLDPAGNPSGPSVVQTVGDALPPEPERDDRKVRRAQRRGQEALRRAADAPQIRLPRRNVAELGAAAGEMRRAMQGNGRYTPPARKGSRRR